MRLKDKISLVRPLTLVSGPLGPSVVGIPEIEEGQNLLDLYHPASEVDEVKCSFHFPPGYCVPLPPTKPAYPAGACGLVYGAALVPHIFCLYNLVLTWVKKGSSWGVRGPSYKITTYIKPTNYECLPVIIIWASLRGTRPLHPAMSVHATYGATLIGNQTYMCYMMRYTLGATQAAS